MILAGRLSPFYRRAKSGLTAGRSRFLIYQKLPAGEFDLRALEIDGALSTRGLEVPQVTAANDSAGFLTGVCLSIPFV